MIEATERGWRMHTRQGSPAVEIADNVLGLIGRTPMVRLARLGSGLPCPVVMKLETTNPGGSVKDRPALAMIEHAERTGELVPGGTIVEPTSGNTGVGLAIVAAQRGYRCVFVTTNKVAPEKIALLRAYGAEVTVCDVAVPPDDPDSYYSTAERLVREIPNAYRPNQYANAQNPAAHEAGTGPEIWQQTDGQVTHFVAGAGTGGTLTGVGRYLKRMNPAIRIVAADPEGSVYSGGSGRPYLVEGIGEDFWPSTYDPAIVDLVVAVSDSESFATAREVTRSEGILIGGSGGTAVAAARRIAASCGAGDLIVVLIPDSGRGYLSRVFDDEWMARYGFSRASGAVVGDVLASRQRALPALVYIDPERSVRDAIELMREHGVSQLPVAGGEMPLAAAEVKGAVDELHLMDLVFADSAALDMPVESVMSPPLLTIGAGQPVGLAVELLDAAAALMVLDGGRPRTIVSRSDLLGFLSQ